MKKMKNEAFRHFFPPRTHSECYSDGIKDMNRFRKLQPWIMFTCYCLNLRPRPDDRQTGVFLIHNFSSHSHVADFVSLEVVALPTHDGGC